MFLGSHGSVLCICAYSYMCSLWTRHMAVLGEALG